MASRDDLMGELNAAYQKFVEAISGLEESAVEEKWLDKRWGVREISAHIAGWLGQLGGGMERMSRGSAARRANPQKLLNLSYAP